jgi:hypothetical protein
MKNTYSQKTAWIDELFNTGYVFLPDFNYKGVQNDASAILNKSSSTHIQNSKLHLDYLHLINVNNSIVEPLADAAYSRFNIKVSKNDLYCITKVIKPGEVSVSDRPHFDSHLFTLITPISIPEATSEERGQLAVHSKIRTEPESEILNLFGKLKFYLMYSSKKGYRRLSVEFKPKEFDFSDMCPIMFLGRQNFHCSMPFQSKMPDSTHILLITHFFDPSPFWSIGSINRIIRNR